MRFIETGLKGLYLLELELLEDERGYFARYFCREEFVKHGLNPDVSLGWLPVLALTVFFPTLSMWLPGLILGVK